MKLPEKSAVVAKVKTAVEAGGRHSRTATEKAVTTGRTVLQTKTGQRVATGAAAGAVIGAALPLVTMMTGAMLGAGVLVLVKAMKDAD